MQRRKQSGIYTIHKRTTDILRFKYNKQFTDKSTNRGRTEVHQHGMAFGTPLPRCCCSLDVV